jgi:flagellar basal-body rod protein FlgC
MDLNKTLHISAAGMKVQGVRLKVIAENIANAQSLSPVPGGDPYRRKVVSFQNALDRSLGLETVRVRNIDFDRSDFRKEYDVGHPAADEDGYVSYPNVNSLIEMMDLKEAERSYQANLEIIDVSRSMLTRTIDLLR